MVTKKLLLNEKYYCSFCGINDNKRQSVRHVEKNRSMFVFNCSYCHRKYVVTIMKEGFIHPQDNVMTRRFPEEDWNNIISNATVTTSRLSYEA